MFASDAQRPCEQRALDPGRCLALHLLANLFIDSGNGDKEVWPNLLKRLRQEIKLRTIGQGHAVLKACIVKMPGGDVRERQERNDQPARGPFERFYRVRKV